jgi:apolipoprotein N-acyltransferase
MPERTQTPRTAYTWLLLLFTLGLVWLATVIGLAAKSVEMACIMPMLLYLLPFLGSSFVAASSMCVWLRQFAEYRPFTLEAARTGHQLYCQACLSYEDAAIEAGEPARAFAGSSGALSGG